MVSNWSSKDVVRFLDVYEESEGLWNIRHSDYKNKIKRDSAMLKLMDELLKRNVPVESVEVLRKKIKSIKNVYRQELKKIEKSKKNGAGADDVYQPKLAWFKRADIFLKNVTSSRTTTSNLVSTFVLLHNFLYFYYIHL
jgi:plasmid replication initiation protein